MRLRRTTTLLAAPALAAGLLAFSPAAALAATTTLTAEATGEQEVPGPGDEDGSAVGMFAVDGATGEVCYTATAEEVGTIAAAHIHVGAAGVAGPIVLPLDHTKINSGSETCMTAEEDLAAKIMANPANYYFNVHTPDFPAGAVRGQLVAGAPGGADAGSGGAADDGAPTALLVTLVAAGGLVAAGSARRLARG